MEKIAVRKLAFLPAIISASAVDLLMHGGISGLPHPFVPASHQWRLLFVPRE